MVILVFWMRRIPGGFIIDGPHKAEFLKEGICLLILYFARDVLVMKKLEIEKTKPTFIISTFKTDIIKVGLVFFNFQLFHY